METFCGNPLKCLAQFLLQFFEQLFIISARVTALAIFASQVQSWVFLTVAMLHFLLMLFVAVLLQPTCCRMWKGEPSDKEDKEYSRLARVLEAFSLVLASFVQVFIFFDVCEGDTCLCYTVYYIFLHLENSAMVLAWYELATNLDHTVRMVVSVIVWGALVSHLFIALYYKFCHPNSIDNSDISSCKCYSCCRKAPGTAENQAEQTVTDPHHRY